MLTSMRRNRKGFTLIELMVVISIIALLSSVVLASVSSARQKASDVVATARVKEYTNALLQIRNSDDTFPHAGYTTYCLGNNTSCPVNGIHDSAVDSSIDYYFPGSPPVNSPPVNCSSSGLTNGLAYQCMDSGNCTKLYLSWCMRGNATCPGGIGVRRNGNTYCMEFPFPN